MHLFLDFKASSASATSHPIEIAWVTEEGQETAFLISPEPSWTDWSPTAEAVHGIFREHLLSEGFPASTVARTAAEAMGRTDATVLVGSEGHDGRWLRVLLEAAGLPCPQVRSYLDALHGIIAARPTSMGIDQAEVRSRGWAAIRAAQEEDRNRYRPVHRALPDAHGMRRVWRALAHEG